MHVADLDEPHQKMFLWPPALTVRCCCAPMPGRQTVHHAKLQATQDMSEALRRYAIADPKFPPRAS